MTQYRNYLAVLPILAAAVFISHGLQRYLDNINAVMVYMLAVVVSAFFLDLGAAIVTCLLSVALFDFFNLPPYLAFSRGPLEYMFTLGVMVTTAGVISMLAKRLRSQVQEAQNREVRASAMYAMSTDLAAARTNAEIVELTVKHISEALHANVIIHPASQDNPSEAAQVLSVRNESGVERLTGLLRTGTGETQKLDVMTRARPPSEDTHRRHLQAMLEQASLAMERNALRQQIMEARLKEQEHTLRTTILNTISHDLRTPLASVIGAASSLIEQGDSFTPADRQELRQIIYEEALHIQGMVENLLDMARIQSGSFQYSQDWQAIEEIVAGAMTILRRRVLKHELVVAVPDNLPLIRCDGFLLERVIVNLVENAVRYSPEHTAIRIEAQNVGAFLELRVTDQGRGIPADQLLQVFEPFHRLAPEGPTGIGLGLTICQSIISAYGGQIDIESEPGVGTCLRVRLPIPLESDLSENLSSLTHKDIES